MFDYRVSGQLYVSALVGLAACVRYWLYKDRLRVPAKYMYAILMVLAMASGLFWIKTGGIEGISFDVYRVLVAILLFLLSCFIITAPLAEHAFSYAFLLAFISAVETTASYVQINFFPGKAIAYTATSLIIMSVLFFPYVRLLKRMIERLSDMGNDKTWVWLDVACFSFLSMNLLVTLPHPASMGILYPVGRYLMLLGMMGVYKATERIMDAMRTAADSMAELKFFKRRLALQQSYYDRMVTQMDEVRRMRHDLRHHKAAIMALIRSGDLKALAEYTDLATAPEEPLPMTGNLALDSLLLYFGDEAKAEGITFDTTVAVGKHLPITDPELCIIFGNLLENAIEAQAFLPMDKRYIRVTAVGSESGLTVAVDNKFDGQLSTAHGGYNTRKTGEGHGLGLSSVRAICEKHGGVLQTDVSGDRFMAGVDI